MYGRVWVQLYYYSYIVKPLVSTGRAIAKIGPEKVLMVLWVLHFCQSRMFWSMGSPWQRAMLLESLLMSGCGLSHEFVHMASKEAG